MPFRDDREALLARVEALERSLAETREDAEDERERLLEEKERLIRERDRARAEAEAARRGDTTPKVVDLSEASSVEKSPPVVHVDTEETTFEKVKGYLLIPWELFMWWWEDQLLIVKVLVVLGVLAAIGYYVYQMHLVAELDREADVTWTATVSSARGLDLPAGEQCTVVADLRGNGDEDFVVRSVVVQCGSQEIYDWNDAAQLISGDDAPRPRRGCSELRQRLHYDDTTYSLQCSDTGGRVGGRPELGLDTPNGTANVWRDTPPIFRVELDVEPWSRPSTTLPLLGTERGRPAWYD